MTLALNARAKRMVRDHGAVELGVEPPISANGRDATPFDRRQVSMRWLSGTVLVGITGGAMIAAAIYAALDRQAVVVNDAEYMTASGRDDAADAGEGLRKGDRLIKAADIVAEKQSFRVPVTLTVGDKQVIRMEGFTHVATTLTLAPTGLGDQVPPFNPLKLLASDQQGPADTPVDPGPALDESDASFTADALATADTTAFAAGLSADEIQAQVADFAKASASSDTSLLSLPSQLMLMRTSRATLNVAGSLSYAAAENIMTAPFSSIEVKMVPENVIVVQQTNRAHEGPDQQEKLVILHHGETLEDVLRGAGAARDQIRAITTAFGARRGESPVAEGRRLKILTASLDGRSPPQIARISVYADETLETTVALEDTGGYVQVSRVDPNPKLLRASRPKDDDADDDAGGMELYESLYETALKQNIPKPVIDDLVRVFGNDVDFQRSVAAGDTFDAFYADGDEEGHKDLFYASITVRDETFKYYRFQAPDDGGVDFYDENGRSTRKFLIRKPVPVGEMTSGFGIRFHPILGYTRPHTGVDWGAPIGTPILAAGSGTVLTAERNSSYGNHIEVQHANGYVTTYSHMSGFARGIVSGTKVRQGQVIGYLGQTGLATGPHLHYEVIVNGHFVDPMRVKLARTREIEGKMLASFRKEHDRIDALMASAPNAVQDQKHASD